MKSKLMILVMCLMCVFGISNNAIAGLPHGMGWQLLRSVTAVDNPLLLAATMDGKPTFAKPIDASYIRNVHLICATTGTVSTGLVTVKVWAGYGSAGPSIPVATITWTNGTMVVNKDPQTQATTTLQYYGSTVSVTNYWPVTPQYPNSGNNTLCMVSFDALDADWLAIEVTTMTNVTKANIYMACIGG